jgi:hypothetical protein
MKTLDSPTLILAATHNHGCRVVLYEEINYEAGNTKDHEYRTFILVVRTLLP